MIIPIESFFLTRLTLVIFHLIWERKRDHQGLLCQLSCDVVSVDLSLPKDTGINHLLSYQALQGWMLRADTKVSLHNVFVVVWASFLLAFYRTYNLSLKRRDFKHIHHDSQTF